MSLTARQMAEWRNSCIRKKQYKTEAGAQKALDWFKTEGILPATADKYKCRHCIGWHLTSGRNNGYYCNDTKKPDEKCSPGSG